MGIPLLRGRAFTGTDDANAPPVVLVNEAFVRRYFEHQDPLGKRIQVDREGAAPAWSEIVGVVSNVKSYSEETRVDPEIYESFLQRPGPFFSILLRSEGRTRYVLIRSPSGGCAPGR